MTSPQPSTYFRPAGRATPQTVRAAADSIPADSPCRQVLEAIPGLACVLNEQRQIVGLNERFVRFLEAGGRDELLGRRLGEALHCVRTGSPPDGCGTTPACVTCGAAQAMHACSSSGQRQTRECRLTIDRGAQRVSLEFEAVVSPLRLGNRTFQICALRDIGAEKRRQVLEQVFFHDVLNTAGGVAGFADLIVELGPEQPESDVQTTLARLAHQLVEEIEAQRALASAERGELRPAAGVVDMPALLEDVAALYRAHEVAADRTIVVRPGAPPIWVTDAVLLRRILGNLAKNALEASPPGGVISIGARRDGDVMVCEVHNPGRMPQHVQAQIFQRSFSTKAGSGRGLGTYSIQLFAERVLGGTVSFASGESGTTFAVCLPPASL
jgi:signal transduction histidine kinase